MVRFERVTADPTICAVEGCTTPVVARGWCHVHYMRWYNHGDPTTLLRAPSGDCAAPGCERRARRHGYCAAHDYRVARYGDPLADIPIGAAMRPHAVRRYAATHERVAQPLSALSLAEFVAMVAPTPEPPHVCLVCQRRYRTPVAHLVGAPRDGTCSTVCSMSLREQLAREAAAADARFVRTVGAADVPVRASLLGGGAQ